MAGRRIDNHKLGWMPEKGKDYPLPDGVHHKRFKSAEGSGHVGEDYHDLSEDIEKDQRSGVAKARAHKMKPGYYH